MHRTAAKRDTSDSDPLISVPAADDNNKGSKFMYYMIGLSALVGKPRSKWRLLGLLLWAMVVMYLGFLQSASNLQASQWALIAKLDGIEQQLESEVDVCGVQRNALSIGTSSANLSDHVAPILYDPSWDKRLSLLSQTNKTLTSQLSQCTSKRQKYKSMFELDGPLEENEDAMLLRDDSAVLTSRLRNITCNDGRGAYALLEPYLEARKQYQATSFRCSYTPLLSDGELIDKWTNAIEAEMAVRAEADKVAMRNMLDQVVTWQYLTDNTPRRSDIFLTSNSSDVLLQISQGIPMYFSRYAVPLPIPDATHISTAPLSAQMEHLHTLYDYAMCAYVSNNSNIILPLNVQDAPASKKLPGETSSKLFTVQNFFATPLISRCRDCIGNNWQGATHDACQSHRVSVDNYGGPSYWAMRSMILVHDDIQNAAAVFHAGLKGKKGLAVVLHNQDPIQLQRCGALKLPDDSLHYMYLMKNFPHEVRLLQHVAERNFDQCAPSTTQIIQRLEEVLQQSRMDIQYIYVSAPLDLQEELIAHLREAKKKHILKLLTPSLYVDGPFTTYHHMVDLEIASSATQILVSPFLAASRYVTESFLLRNKLTVTSNVWFF